MTATDSTPDEQRLRAEVRKAVLGRICNVSNLPDWMQTPALGRNMGPLAEIVVDALLPVIAADRERYAQQRAAEVGERVRSMRDGLLFERETRPTSQQTAEWLDLTLRRVVDRLVEIADEATP